jgi:hypothetical protein
MAAEMAVVRLQSRWYRFNRELVMLSATGKCVTSSGSEVLPAPGVRKRRDVIPILNSTYPTKKRRREPEWSSAAESINAAQRLRVSNLRSIASALGSTSSPAGEIRLVRNFLAHRSQESVSELQRLTWWTPKMRLDIATLVATPVIGGASRFETWIENLQTIAAAAVQ